MCQSRHFAPQQIASLFDHLVGSGEYPIHDPQIADVLFGVAPAP